MAKKRKCRKYRIPAIISPDIDRSSEDIIHRVDGEIPNEIPLITIPNVRRIWPELISADICEVQPMTAMGFSSRIFEWEYKQDDPNERVIYPPDDFTKRKD